MSPPAEPPRWRCCGREVPLEPVAVMGILNVTPDSFSDGGRHAAPEAAVAAGLRMLEAGAALLDIGGESTRPGAAPVPLELELARTIPVITALRARADCAISIDTMKAEVARQALAAGACIINDVSALTADPAMPALAAASGAGVVLMHMRGTPQTMQDDPVYADVVAEVGDYLRARLAAALAAGIVPECLVLDPGLGFGKTFEHNLALLRRLPELARLPRPLLIGASRKGFLGRLTGAPAADRLPETIAACLAAVRGGARIVRVHDVGPVVRALRVARALEATPPPGAPGT